MGIPIAEVVRDVVALGVVALILIADVVHDQKIDVAAMPGDGVFGLLFQRGDGVGVEKTTFIPDKGSRRRSRNDCPKAETQTEQERRKEGKSTLACFHRHHPPLPQQQIGQHRHERQADAEEPCGKTTLVDGQIANEPPGLAVHREEKIFPLPLGVEHPDRQQGVVGFLRRDVDVLGLRMDFGVAGDGIPEGICRGLVHPLLGTGVTGLFVLVVPVSQKAGQVCRREGNHRAVIERFDGVHVGVRHLAGTVHRDLYKIGGAVPDDVVELGRCHDVVALPVAFAELALVPAARVNMGVVEPEGNIHALNFLDVVVAAEGFWQEELSFIIPGQLVDGGFPVELEGDDVLGFQFAGEFAAKDGRVAAVGAGGRGGLGIADQLCTAGRAGIAVQPGGFGLAPKGSVRLGFGLLCGFCGLFRVRFGGCVGLCLLAGILGFNLLDLIAGTAVVAGQLSGLAVEMQGAGAGRTLVVRGFC